MTRLPREAVLLFVVAYVIGLIMLFTAGIYDGPLAEPSLVLAAFCLGILGLLFSRDVRRAPSQTVLAGRGLLIVPILLAIFCSATLADRRLLIDATEQSTTIRIVQLLQVALLCSYVPSLWRGTADRAVFRHARFFGFAGLLVLCGIVVMHASPTPEVDLFKVHDEGAKALLKGQNPYVVLHIVETTADKHVIGFVYPPTVCYLNAIAYALGRDVRWGMLTGVVATGIAFRAIVRRKGQRGAAIVEDAPALFLWLTPKALFFLEQSWNDIYPLTLLSLALMAHAFGKRTPSAVLLGLALSAKQTMIWFVPLALLLGFGALEWLVYLSVASLTVLPFVVLDFFALKRWLFDMFVAYAPKTGTLSALNFVYRHFGVVPKSTLGLVLAALTSAVAAWRAPRTAYSFALAATLAIFLFFFFNIWMCMNNYFFLAGCALLAAALVLGEQEPEAVAI